VALDCVRAFFVCVCVAELLDHCDDALVTPLYAACSVLLSGFENVRLGGVHVECCCVCVWSCTYTHVFPGKRCGVSGTPQPRVPLWMVVLRCACACARAPGPLPLQVPLVLVIVGAVMCYNLQLVVYHHAGRWLCPDTDEPKGQLFGVFIIAVHTSVLHSGLLVPTSTYGLGLVKAMEVIMIGGVAVNMFTYFRVLGRSYWLALGCMVPSCAVGAVFLHQVRSQTPITPLHEGCAAHAVGLTRACAPFVPAPWTQCSSVHPASSVAGGVPCPVSRPAPSPTWVAGCVVRRVAGGAAVDVGP
jgi:hypothetical protein